MQTNCSKLLLFALTACATSACAPTGDPADPDVPCPDAGPLPASLSDRFTLTDPAPGGDIFLLSQAPSDPDRLYSVSHNNGVHRSDDGGRSWAPINTRITHMAGQLSVHPSDPDRIAYCADSLYLSYDGGERWVETDLGGVDPGQRVRGALWRGDALYAIDQDGDLWRSEDGLTGWTWLLTVGRRHGNPNGWSMQDDWAYLFDAGEDLWVAEQQGSVWRVPGWSEAAVEVDAGPVNLSAAGLEPDGSLRYAVHEELRVASVDERWALLGRIEKGEIVASARAADGTLVAYNSESAWLLRGSAFLEEQLPALVLGPASALALDGAVLVAHSEGVARSSDGVEAWEDSSLGVVDTDLAVPLAHPSCPGLVYVGTQCERGLYVSESWGDALWHLPEYAHYVMGLAVNPQRPTELWMTSDDMVMRSDNMGYAWTQTFPDELRAHLHGLAVDPHDPDRVLVGSVGSGEYADDSGRVYITEDGGESWAAADLGLPQTESSMHALTFVAEHPDVVILGTYRGGDINHSVGQGEGLFRSEDGGWSWSEVSTPSPTIGQVRDCPGGLFAASEGGLLVSQDAGLTWSLALETGSEVLDLACREELAVAIDKEGLIWRSADAGVSWAEWAQDYPLRPGGFAGSGLTISPDGQAIYAAVGGQGLYVAAL